MNRKDVLIVSAVRTPIGTFGGALKDRSTSELGAIVVREALARAGIEAERAKQIVLGNVIQCEPNDMYVSRIAGINAGMRKEAVALN